MSAGDYWLLKRANSSSSKSPNLREVKGESQSPHHRPTANTDEFAPSSPGYYVAGHQDPDGPVPALRLYTPRPGTNDLALPWQSANEPPSLERYVNPIDLSGPDERAYYPAMPSKHGHGLCIIMANNEDNEPVIKNSINELETFYDSKSIKVIGGSKDINKHLKRNLSLTELIEIITKLNLKYDPDVCLEGTEYDRVFIHLFSMGDRDYLVMRKDIVVHKLTILERIATKLNNLTNKIPVAVFLHSYADFKIPAELAAPLSFSGPERLPPNIIGLFTIEQPCTERKRMWVINEYVNQANLHHERLHLTDILLEVNKKSKKDNQAEIIAVESGFKHLYFTMSDQPRGASSRVS